MSYIQAVGSAGQCTVQCTCSLQQRVSKKCLWLTRFTYVASINSVSKISVSWQLQMV